MSQAAYTVMKQLLNQIGQPVEGAPEVESLRQAVISKDPAAMVAAIGRCLDVEALPPGFIQPLLDRHGLRLPPAPRAKAPARVVHSITKKPCGCGGKAAVQTGAPVTRPSCLECVEKHLGAAWVLIAENRDGYPHRLRAIGHLHEAEDESQAWSELHEAIRTARKAYQQNGAMPKFAALAMLMSGLAPLMPTIKRIPKEARLNAVAHEARQPVPKRVRRLRSINGISDPE